MKYTFGGKIEQNGEIKPYSENWSTGATARNHRPLLTGGTCWNEMEAGDGFVAVAETVGEGLG